MWAAIDRPTPGVADINLARLARRMAGLPEEKLKSKVSQMFSLAAKFRKTDRHDSSPPVA